LTFVTVFSYFLSRKEILPGASLRTICTTGSGVDKNMFGRIVKFVELQCQRSAVPRNKAMKNLYYREKAPVIDMVMAIAEGLWNGIVVSGVLTVSVLLIKSIMTLYFN
jgi:hypothetical protein